MTDKPKTPAAPPPAPERTLEEVMAVKKAKVLELKGRGVDVFPARSVRVDACARVAELAPSVPEGGQTKEVLTCAGRLMQIRDMGKSIFAHLQDGSGRCQIYFKKDSLPEEMFGLVKKDLHAGDFVSVAGPVFKTKTGEPTIAVTGVVLLAKALRPMPEKWHGLTNVDTRYRQRHLDLIANAEVKTLFEQRSKIISTVRRVLDSRGYVEVETPILLAQAGGASARPFHTHHNALGADMVLRIATELYLKRLIIGGMDKVYEIGRVFRNEGLDTRHNPEFTMLEAYEAYTDYEGMAKLFEQIVVECADAVGKTETEFNGVKIDLKKFNRLYLPEAWEKYCGEKIDGVLEGKGFNRQGLEKLAAKVGAPGGKETPSAKLFERIFDARILEHLDPLTFVFDHPTAITPLAKLKPGGGEGLVERFECYAAKQELSNAYSELNDPLDQRDRLAEQAKQKQAGDDEADMLDEDFVQALECGMPPTGGIGVGIDRLVMVLTGHASIREVIPFPTLKPPTREDEGAE